MQMSSVALVHARANLKMLLVCGQPNSEHGDESPSACNVMVDEKDRQQSPVNRACLDAEVIQSQ